MVLSPEGQRALRRLRELDEGERASTRRPGRGCRRSTARSTRSAPNGNTPNSLALTPDGEMLFVANADANNLAVFNVADPQERQAARVHPDRLVSDHRCATTRRTRRSTSPTARG